MCDSDANEACHLTSLSDEVSSLECSDGSTSLVECLSGSLIKLDNDYWMTVLLHSLIKDKERKMERIFISRRQRQLH